MLKENTRNGTNKAHQLIDQIAKFRHDPFGFVLFAFPWGEPGELKDCKGPRAWQRDVLENIGHKLNEGAAVGDAINDAIRVAVASGHGIGKSALVSWLIAWGLSTCPETKIVATANTATQLETKTWAEVAKWFRLAINSSWFEVKSTSVYVKSHQKTWRCDAIPWSDGNPEAFAGLHNAGKRVVVIFDEASSIADIIWEVAEGAMTDTNTELIWLAFGNPTLNTGRFRDCFGRYKHRWLTRQIDSRTVEGSNTKQAAEWVADYGEDSDFVRVRVRGVFPRAGSRQLIPSDIVTEAAKRDPVSQHYDPLIMSIDVARFGTDQSIIGFRRGRDARTIPPKKYRGVDTMHLSGEAAGLIDRYRPDAVFIDETGIGGAVVDRLRQLGHKVVGVNNGNASDWPLDNVGVHDKGSEMWVRMRDWIKTGGAIANDTELCSELESREFGYDANNYIRIEKKDDLRKRVGYSPDNADQLALTFAHPVAQKFSPLVGQASHGRAVSDWDPYA